jgi:hypothetical protein
MKYNVLLTKKLDKKLNSAKVVNDTRELYNINYTSEFDEKVVRKNILNRNDDFLERSNILTKVKNFTTNDIFTRQFVITESYINNKQLNACLSLFQFRVIKKSKQFLIDEFVFVRSQNFDKNWEFDNQSYMMFLQEARKTIAQMFFQGIYLGKIYVHVTSLHRII